MRMTKKRSKLLTQSQEYLIREPDKDMVNMYLKTRPIDELADLYLIATPETLRAPHADFTVEQLEEMFKQHFTDKSAKVFNDLEGLYKTFLFVEKQNKLDEAASLVKMMVQYKNRIGSLVVRVLRNINEYWRVFFMEIIPGLKKKYLVK